MPISPDTELHLVDNHDEAEQMLRWLSETKTSHLVVDAETTGLDPATDRIRTIQLGDNRHGWVMPVEGARSWGGLAALAMDRWEKNYLMHNAVFDFAMLSAWGYQIPRRRIDDTKIMAAILEPLMSMALKSQASRHVDRQAAGAQRALDEAMAKYKWNWATIPILRSGPARAYWAYGALDCVLTAHLYDYHAPTIAAQCPDAYDLELATAFVCERMERRGAACDRSFTQGKYDGFVRYVRESAEYAQAEWGVNPGSTTAVCAVLKADGVQLTKKTPGGAFSLDREVLEETAPLHPLAALVLKRRRAEKVAGSFLAPFLELSARDGRLHPHINSVGGRGKSGAESGGLNAVRTLRMSMDSPNLQGLPRVGDGNPAADVVRNCIVSDPDETLLTCDYDQVELRLLAHFAEDPVLCAAFGQEVDAFTALARQIYKDPDLVRKDPRRNTTKNAIYATGYGAGVGKFSITAKISQEDGQAFMNDFHRTVPGLRRVMSKLSEVARTTGYVLSPITGKRIHAEDGLEYKLLNALIQNTAAEVLKTAILAADNAGLGDYLLLPVHDELILSVPDHEIRDATKLLIDAMEDHTTFSVPLTAGASTGKRWGEKVAC